MTVVLIPYDDFPKDLRSLNPAARTSLGRLLERLQASPYDPTLQQECELGPEERYAYTLPEGYVVYWKIESDSRAILSPLEEEEVTIWLTAIRRLKT